MQTTHLLYLDDFCSLCCEANIIERSSENERDIIILNQTIFYPQGGGQPFDQGIITSLNATFFVEEVRSIENSVKHIGKLEKGQFKENEKVNCSVNPERRHLNSRLHSAGHVVDMAVQALGLNWVPGKGYHFPNGPYVEYAGSLEGVDKENLKSQLEKTCNQFIHEDRKTTVRFVDKKNLKLFCDFIPDYVSEDKPIRIVLFGDKFAVPCGGTHVAHLSQIQSMTIRKIKTEKGNIRVSYDIA